MSQKKPKVAKLQMKPTTVTTGYGTGSYDPKTGNVGYTLSDPLAQMRDIFYGASQQFLPSQEQTDYANRVGQAGMGFFNNAVNLDLDNLASQYYNKQQDILAPQRERESAQLADTMFASGRTGYGAGTQGGYLNPQQFALQQAREQQNAQLLLGAEDRARAIQQQEINKGLSLSDASNVLMNRPYQNTASLFGLGTNLEALGMGTLNTVGAFAPLQQSWQQAQQKNQQAINDAKASGGFMSGIGGSLLNAGLNYATGGLSGGITSAMGGGSIGDSLGGLFSSFNGSSPSSSLFGSSGWGGNWGSVDRNVMDYAGPVYPRY